LYQAIITKWGEGRMPPDNPLSLENRMIIRLWIEQGANLTLCPDSIVIPPGGPSYSNPRACFSRDILPVLVSSCGMAGCHDATSHKSGYIYVSYSTALKSVRAGSPSGSKLYQVISATGGEDRMPPSPKPRLLQAQIDSIAAWIRYGALDEVCGEVCDTINTVTFSGAIWPTIQTSCTGCHSGTTPSGAISLASYANVQTVAASGLLMKSLTGNGVTKMPPSGSFSACKIRQFQIWINKGYLNN
jgi:cytochrome c5